MNEVLQSLVANTPSASLKLSAAWDGLSTESQMDVLHAMRDRASHEAGFPMKKAPTKPAAPKKRGRGRPRKNGGGRFMGRILARLFR